MLIFLWSVGRGTKHLADLTLQSGLASEASAHYAAAIDVLKGANDWLWLGGAYEGLCAASAALLFPNLGKVTVTLQRNASLQEKTSPDKYKGHNSIGSSPAVIPTSLPDPRPIELQHCLSPDDISKKYRESITHYSKYLHAAVLETEACFKAARIATAQNKRLQASSFLQNVILINLNLTEEQKIERFLAIAELYHTLGFFRKASFYRRLAGKRHVSAQNPNPDWSRCYQLLLQALPGLRLSLDPNIMMTGEQQGWPALQIQLLQELVAASKRMGSPQVAVRHLTFLLQAMWIHLNPIERRDLSLQLQAAASQCEGAPVPLVLPATGVVLPPANLTSIPFTRYRPPFFCLIHSWEQQGWPALQIQLLQELVAASKRMGSPQVAVRHLTFLLQAMWIHLNPIERRDLSLQLQAAASQCEGAPVPLVLPATGVVLPPANLTSIPFTR
ncbi:hypothetical protein B566_EDAN006510 [Ephemera danica]|nr:hypothetical protein B566_EDAN006510 [Ephemera danica]